MVSDNGKGCNKLIDGMGISGMRKRVGCKWNYWI